MERTETLLACCMLMLTVGAMYSFSAFSGRLGEEMNFDATELNLIGTAYNLGTWFGVLGGLFCDRFGPLLTIRYGAVVCNIGTIGSALACLGVLPRSSAMLAALAFVFSQGTGWAYLAGMKQGLQVFHRSDHSSVVGTLSCYVALSAGVLSQLYKCVLSMLPLYAFYLIFGLTCALLQLGATHFFGEPFDSRRHSAPELSESESRRVKDVMFLAIALMCWIFVMSLIESHTKLSQFGMFGLWCVMTIIVCCIPLLSIVWRRRGDGARDAHALDAGHDALSHPDDHDVAVVEAKDTARIIESDACVEDHREADCVDNESMVNSMVEENIDDVDVTNCVVQAIAPCDSSEAQPATGIAYLMSAAATLNFWLLAIAITTALAFPVTFLNNLAPLVQSTRSISEGSDDALSAHLERVIGADIALFSVGNSLGRLLSGYLAHTFASRLHIPRWGFFLGASLLQLTANGILLMLLELDALYWVAFIGGAGLGVTFSIAPIATSDMFGEQHFATMWGALTISPCITTELLGTLLAGHVADAAGRKSHIFVNGHEYCSGTACFQLTFVVTIAVEVVCAIATILLLRRLLVHRSS